MARWTIGSLDNWLEGGETPTAVSWHSTVLGYSTVLAGRGHKTPVVDKTHLHVAARPANNASTFNYSTRLAICLAMKISIQPVEL